MTSPIPNPIQHGVDRGFLLVPVVESAPTDAPPVTDSVALLRARIVGATIVLYAYTPTTGWVDTTLS